MRHEFRLADIGEGLEEAEIISWFVGVGDHVTRDQPLIEVMTDKSNAELPAPQAGVIVELGGVVGDVITVGELIAVIEEPADDSQPVPAVEPHTASTADVLIPEIQPPSALETADAPADGPVAARPKASPSTRRAAAERGIDLGTVVGTGPGGRILLTDLDGAVAPPQVSEPVAAASAAMPEPVAPSPSPAPAVSRSGPASTAHVDATGVVPLRGIRRAVARNMAQSWSEIPHIHAFQEIDAEPMRELRATLRNKGGAAYQSVTPLTFFVAAVARALAQHPEANATIHMADETISYHSSVNVGVAVASDQGLIVPVLQGADRLDFKTLAVTLAELVRAAREGALAREHFLGGTVTISNFGALGGEQALPLIRPPEAMIVGFGSIAKRPFVVDDQVIARSTMHTVVGADHRLLDGDVTTAVLNTIGSLLSEPLQLVI